MGWNGSTVGGGWSEVVVGGMGLGYCGSGMEWDEDGAGIGGGVRLR